MLAASDSMRPKPSIELSIIIVNWNSKDYVAACIESILTSDTSSTYEIVVVDGGSFDGCDAMIASRFPSVVFVQSPDNIGFGRSNNLGFEHASGESVLLLNPDTVVAKGSLDLLVESLKQLPQAGAVGPRLLNSDGTLQTSCVQPLPTPANQALDSDFLRRLLPNSKLWSLNNAFGRSEPTEVQALSGACIAMPSRLYREVGGFTPNYFMYAEDMDLCLKVQRAGYKVYHNPRSHIVHHGGGSSQSTFSKFSVVMNLDALSIYMCLNHGRLAKLRYRSLMLLSAALRVPLIALAYLSSSEEPVRRKRTNSLRRWTATMRWCFGLENWTRKYQST